MLPETSIVQVDKRPYRTIAQENWGLTKEQMKGMHVHHRISISEGGTDDPTNLYVCSPSFHRWGWHNGEEFIEWASEGGRKGGKKGGKKAAELGLGIHGRSAEQRTEDSSKGGTKTADLGVGIHAPGMQSKGGTIGGRKAAELGVGVHGRSAEQRTEDSSKGGKTAAELGLGVHAPGMQSKGGKKVAELGLGIHAPGMQSKNGIKGGKTTTSQKWICLETGHISNPGALSKWQKARGIDTSMRVRIDQG